MSPYHKDMHNWSTAKLGNCAKILGITVDLHSTRFIHVHAGLNITFHIIKSIRLIISQIYPKLTQNSIMHEKIRQSSSRTINLNTHKTSSPILNQSKTNRTKSQKRDKKIHQERNNQNQHQILQQAKFPTLSWKLTKSHTQQEMDKEKKWKISSWKSKLEDPNQRI